MREVHPKPATEEICESSRVSRTGYEELKQLCTFFWSEPCSEDHWPPFNKPSNQQVIC